MGGKIWAESTYGKGTAFNFTAVFSVGEEKIKEVALPSKDMRGMKVLVVDDNATSRRILKDLLESFSFNVSLAVSGEEGIDEIERADTDDPFKLVLMDWKMPGINGIEAAARIKNHAQLTHKPPIILVTAYGREEVLQDAENVGLDGFLLKPVNPSVLFDSVVMAFGKEGLEHSDSTKEEIGSAEKMKEIEGAKVLLVEDNEINQQVAREILEETGLSITLASNGQEAVEAVASGSFDAVLMDIQMPVMDGYTATKKIRNLSSDIRNVPIVAMTAHAMAGDAERSLAAGMNDHVTKPIDPDQLLSTLHKWISPKKDRDHSQEIRVTKELSAEGNQPAVDELPDSLPGFDLEEGLTRLQGNRRLYIKLLQGFATNYATAVSDIQSAVDRQDWGQAQHRVHDIKGLAGNLAAKQLHASAAEFEQLLKDVGSNHSPVSKAVDQKLAALIKDFTQALEAVQSLGGQSVNSSVQLTAEEGDTLPSDLAQEVAARIRNAVEIGDVTQLTTIADDLVSRSDAYAPYREKIVRMADDFDFDGLIELADGLTG
jgi:CheY-like chemotaxis protein